MGRLTPVLCRVARVDDPRHGFPELPTISKSDFGADMLLCHTSCTVCRASSGQISANLAHNLTRNLTYYKVSANLANATAAREVKELEERGKIIRLLFYSCSADSLEAELAGLNHLEDRCIATSKWQSSNIFMRSSLKTMVIDVIG